jgi:hypothetical protein
MNPINPHVSVVNEIFLVYFLNGEKLKPSLKKILKKNRLLIGRKNYHTQKLKSKAMAEEFLKWVRKNKFASEVDHAWWTSRNGYLSKVLKIQVNSKENPCDVLVKFKNGKYLGISAKTTTYHADLPFKSKGVKNVEKFLNLDLNKIVNKHTNKFVKKHKLHSTFLKRKEQIRSKEKIAIDSEKQAKVMFNEIINEVHKKLTKCTQDKRKEFIIKHWLDSSKTTYPAYVKITAMGAEYPFKVKIENPFENINIKYIKRENIKFIKTGNNSILVYAGKRKIMRIRVRSGSQKFASSIKFSGDTI